MLQTSINSDYNNDIPQWPEIEHQLKCIADAKFTHTSWIHDWDGDYMYSASEMKYARDLVNGYGLIAHTRKVWKYQAGQRGGKASVFHLQLGGDDLRVRGRIKCDHPWLCGTRILPNQHTIPY